MRSDEVDTNYDKKFDSDLRQRLADAETKLLLWKRRALVTTSAFVLSCISVVPFLYGFPLHKYWESLGKNLLLVSMCLLPIFAFCSGIAYSFWDSVRSYKRIQKM